MRFREPNADFVCQIPERDWLAQADHDTDWLRNHVAPVLAWGLLALFLLLLS